jgi:lambda family phage minor tail protein L
MASISSEVVKLNPTAIIELFTLTMPAESGGLSYYFHCGVNMFKEGILFGGQRYDPFPIEAEGFALSGKGEIPRPKIRIANLTSYIRGLVLNFDDLIGAKVVRTRTFAKFIDSANFLEGVNPDADPSKILSQDEYYIERKTTESKSVIEFELTSPFDLENIKLPRRQIFSNLCGWAYRSAECGYTGGLKANKKDETAPFAGTLTDRGLWSESNSYAAGDYCYLLVEDVRYYFLATGTITASIYNRPPNHGFWIAEQCSKLISGCKIRYGEDGVLPIGIFPGTNKLPLSE